MTTGHIAGVDGCKGGWLVVSADVNLSVITSKVYLDFASIINTGFIKIAVDIPIGLPDRGSRACDLEARRLLGPRRNSVFPCPIRPVASSNTYADACAMGLETDGRALSRQAWAIVPKIREVDIAMGAVSQERVIEVHPELCFLAMNDGRPLEHPKKLPEGLLMRRELLIRHEFPTSLVTTRPPRGATLDDMYDALAALWTAHRHVRGVATCVPGREARDASGLRMSMWF